MYSITICFGPAATVWNLLYKDEERARAAMALLVTPPDQAIATVDDFGQNLVIYANEVRGILFEDMDQSQLAQIERGLHNARSQAKAQTRGMEDPVIKESLRRQQMGPAVMSPMPNGRFNG